MPHRLPHALQELVRRAGYADLSEWIRAANVAPSTLYGARWRGRKLSDRTIQRFLVVAHASVTQADLAVLLLRASEVAR
jgi:hypothetical protein